jgi:hypothetical protein
MKTGVREFPGLPTEKETSERFIKFNRNLDARAVIKGHVAQLRMFALYPYLVLNRFLINKGCYKLLAICAAHDRLLYKRFFHRFLRRSNNK